MATQVYAFATTVLAGGLIGFAFDIYRTLRGVMRPRRFATDVGDVLFWVCATVLVFSLLLRSSWGEVRLYVFLGMALGYIWYRTTFGPTVIRVSSTTLKSLGFALGAVSKRVGGHKRSRPRRRPVLGYSPVMVVFTRWRARTAQALAGMFRRAR